MQKVLIANRGEIALRIIRTCQKLGIQTVAVYSEADSKSLFVRAADESVLIGPSPVQQSYLQMDRILEAARQKGADAIHPGYGLLSENSVFAQKVEDAGLIWIGPKPEVIAWMGDKAVARAKMCEVGVPLVPGTKVLSTLEKALSEARGIGYPVLLKASGGGGGMGMYPCHSEAELIKYYAVAVDRAKVMFGNATVFLEKYLPSARHIEVQIAADRSGKVVHLGERDCSVQRRHQKIIEESPAPYLPEAVRERLVETAVRAASAIGYENVGTVEFLVDSQNQIYFLEMNTRLQVEHTVTEAVTGIDLVEWQLLLAEGKELPLSQRDIKFQGHAMEFRICAEDPTTFFPSPGTITKWLTPTGTAHRLDSAVESGSIVTPFYDSLMAKWIVSGSNREETIRTTLESFAKWEIAGVKSNMPLLKKILENPVFQSGEHDTKIIETISKAK
ncbi:acetyl-CoA carboxylase biotin carboxylase subunit [Risungbinella massiliensis]|uniref:acetyl-CoA carboxylase biotin carboxylase subunit n=1 Tax=Risungbinella massiliensis TaxID=1329796 RepID=UPI0005CC5960|nr:acetyl-CoA carboxylase biotin carboxylase subunit [Risungbinella massiliensis]